MKTLLCIFLTFSQFTIVFGQSQWGVSYRVKTGFLAAHKSVLSGLPSQPALASELSCFRRLHQEKSWVEDYNDPTLGLTLFMGSVGNNEVLGRYLALYGFADLPIVRNKNFELLWKFGTGLGITNRKFDPIFNPENIAISSHLNMMIVLALKAQYRFNKNSLSVSCDITHFSNSSFKVPNLGINIPYISFGYSRIMGKVNRPIRLGARYKLKHIYIGSFGQFSLKEIFPEGGRKYPIYSGAIFAQSKLGAKVGLELGFDLFSNQAHFDFEPLVEKSQWTILQLGIYGAYFLPMNRTHFIFGMGTYIRDFYGADGPFYHRIGVRYQWLSGFFGHLAIKSHWVKADYLELGLGYVFGLKKSKLK